MPSAPARRALVTRALPLVFAALAAACDAASATSDAGSPDDGPGPSAAFRATVANPAPPELALGERYFYENTWGSELQADLPPPSFLVELWQSDVARWGEQFSNYGLLVDPGDDLPIGLKRGTIDPTRTGRTCALCHVAQLPDGRIWTGFPAVDFRMSAFALAIDEAWVAAGNPSMLSAESIRRLQQLPQPGINSVADDATPYLAPVDFPFYLNFGKRGLFGSDGNAQDARSAILVSIFSLRGSMNPEPFPPRAQTDAFVEFLVSRETPLNLAPDTNLAVRGRQVFDEARCNACHNPDDPRRERVIDWVENGPERLPGEDPEHPNGTIATDGQRYQMTTFSGGVETTRTAFGIFIVRNGLAIGPTTGYIPRDIHATFASAPYLHNGSVPTLEDLLRPAAERPTSFEVRGVTVHTTTDGMSNRGHEFGTTLSDEDKRALIAYLETL